MRSAFMDPSVTAGSSHQAMTLTHSATYADRTSAASPSTAIVSASATAPIVIQAVGHGLETGDMAAVGGVGGGGGANGRWKVRKVDDDNVELMSSNGTAAGTANTGRIQKLPAWPQVLDHIMVNADSNVTNYTPVVVWYGDYDPATDEPIYTQNFRNRANSDIDRSNGIGRSYQMGPRSNCGFIIEGDITSGGWSSGQVLALTALYRVVS